MQLYKRHESLITDVFEPCLFKRSHPLVRIRSKAFGNFGAGKIRRQAVKIDHCSEEYISSSFLLRKSQNVISYGRIFSTPSPMSFVLLSAVCNEHRVMQINA